MNETVVRCCSAMRVLQLLNGENMAVNASRACFRCRKGKKTVPSAFWFSCLSKKHHLLLLMRTALLHRSVKVFILVSEKRHINTSFVTSKKPTDRFWLIRKCRRPLCHLGWSTDWHCDGLARHPERLLPLCCQRELGKSTTEGESTEEDGWIFSCMWRRDKQNTPARLWGPATLDV